MSTPESLRIRDLTRRQRYRNVLTSTSITIHKKERSVAIRGEGITNPSPAIGVCKDTPGCDQPVLRIPRLHLFAVCRHVHTNEAQGRRPRYLHPNSNGTFITQETLPVGLVSQTSRRVQRKPMLSKVRQSHIAVQDYPVSVEQTRNSRPFQETCCRSGRISTWVRGHNLRGGLQDFGFAKGDVLHGKVAVTAESEYVAPVKEEETAGTPSFRTNKM